MASNSSKWIVLASVVCCSIGVALLRESPALPQQPIESAPTPPPAGTHVSASSDERNESRRQPQPLGAPATLVEGAPEYRDYVEASRTLLSAAQAGDANAMFELFSMREYCEDKFKAYFSTGKGRRTLDEGIAWATRYSFTSGEEARATYARCATMMSGEDISDLGNPDEWLDKAARAGNVRAQLSKADRLITALAQEAARQGENSKINRRDARYEEAKRLIVDSYSKDAGATLWTIGDNQFAFAADDDSPENGQFIWWLAACKSGYDCSQNAEWYKFYCRVDYNCQPNETGVDFILRATSDRPGLESLADDLLSDLKHRNLGEVLVATGTSKQRRSQSN